MDALTNHMERLCIDQAVKKPKTKKGAREFVPLFQLIADIASKRDPSLKNLLGNEFTEMVLEDTGRLCVQKEHRNNSEDGDSSGEGSPGEDGTDSLTPADVLIMRPRSHLSPSFLHDPLRHDSSDESETSLQDITPTILVHPVNESAGLSAEHVDVHLEFADEQLAASSAFVEFDDDFGLENWPEPEENILPSDADSEELEEWLNQCSNPYEESDSSDDELLWL